jgi:hypothetical protein
VKEDCCDGRAVEWKDVESTGEMRTDVRALPSQMGSSDYKCADSGRLRVDTLPSDPETEQEGSLGRWFKQGREFSLGEGSERYFGRS